MLIGGWYQADSAAGIPARWSAQVIDVIRTRKRSAAPVGRVDGRGNRQRTPLQLQDELRQNRSRRAPEGRSASTWVMMSARRHRLALLDLAQALPVDEAQLQQPSRRRDNRTHHWLSEKHGDEPLLITRHPQPAQRRRGHAHVPARVCQQWAHAVQVRCAGQHLQQVATNLLIGRRNKPGADDRVRSGGTPRPARSRIRREASSPSASSVASVKGPDTRVPPASCKIAATLPCDQSLRSTIRRTSKRRRALRSASIKARAAHRDLIGLLSSGGARSEAPTLRTCPRAISATSDRETPGLQRAVQLCSSPDRGHPRQVIVVPAPSDFVHVFHTRMNPAGRAPEQARQGGSAGPGSSHDQRPSQRHRS